MTGRVDKSMGIVTLIPETLTKINPTGPLRFAKCAARRKGSDRFIFPVFPKRTQCPRLCVTDFVVT